MKVYKRNAELIQPDRQSPASRPTSISQRTLPRMKWKLIEGRLNLTLLLLIAMLNAVSADHNKAPSGIQTAEESVPDAQKDRKISDVEFRTRE
ncbi:unnamed protein product [Caenorhabditis auriculariae]|uniref:Uncharacterized protein n=1 Tax=Caenorhabditis auriculariae TaxID=2777116 RepID=A0A8S1HLM0_9PELO|nr:unnamed protein product [Caenorhabditis auriculariae]